MQLGFGFNFEQLYAREGLIALDARFVAALSASDTALHNRLMAARANPAALTDKDHSQLLIDIAPHVEDFLGELFGIEKELRALAAAHHALAPLFSCKRLFVQRQAAKLFKEAEVQEWSEPAFPHTEEQAFAEHVIQWMENEAAHKTELDAAARYAAWALYHPSGKKKHARGVLFRLPKKLDPLHLVPVETELCDGVTMLKLPDSHHRPRDGFKLTDPGGTLVEAQDHAHYCIYCHNQGRDSCSKGFKEKDGSFKKNTADVTLAGCPLEEKISEMNFLKAEGVPLGALAMVVVDNPMCAGTGHRICNDCMKSCIYQKQEPVNIPLVETRTLKDVLELPYGFEIYSLLTRWNPLNLARPLPKPDTGYRVLVAGLGPSGYTLAHHLMNDGHQVVGIDGLKIEPLPEQISGVTPRGERVAFEPIKDIAALIEDLDKRTLAGFGGVAEYGITVRWDKNYLKLIRLLLERRAQFAMFGGVRFGGTITYDDAFAMGFDHIALCLGAGKPTILTIENGLARGVRAASDFLMSLQLTGAAKEDSIANLQLRLPVVVVGGGLTAIDTATEALAYYAVQVEKFLTRYEHLCAARSETEVRAKWSEEERQISEEFLSHARTLRTADTAQRSALLSQWGGATILYRRKLADAPSYRLNHEEVEKALEEGIYFAENVEPLAVDVDAFGHASSLRCRVAGEEKNIPARSILIAAGTSPNTVLAREDAEHFVLDGKFFQAVDEQGNPVSPQRIAKPESVHVLHAVEGNRSVSFFGDLHPSFAGNVVKAMASAKQGYPVISRALAMHAPTAAPGFFERLNHALRPTVHAVNRLTPTIVEIVVHARQAAENFQPGQFYRLQNYEAFAARADNITLAMEGLAMTGAWVDKQQGLVALIALEMGGSSDLCAHLKVGEPVVLMGPTGTPTEIPARENVLLAGGGLGNAVLFSIGRALRANGSKVLYFAGYRKAIDRYKLEEIEAAADQVVWCCDEEQLSSRRAQDVSFHGNIVAAMHAYAEGKLGAQHIPMNAIDRIIAIGSDKMMAAVGAARHTLLKNHVKPGHTAIGSINSPMQCMMKEICAQCLQQHKNPQTGEITYVFSCFNQDQCLDEVQFSHLEARLTQNSVQEKLTTLLVDDRLKWLKLR